MASLGRLEIEGRRKHYPARDASGPRPVLKDLRLDLPLGEFLCVLGPSGCGKTTLLNIVAGLDRDFEGRVAWPGTTEAVPRIGYVFQEPRLLPWLTVRQNVDLVLDGAGEGADGDPAFLEHLFDVAGLAAFRDAYPQRLSLGLARRAALVRAFAVKPDLLLMDEPFVSLDRRRGAAAAPVGPDLGGAADHGDLRDPRPRRGPATRRPDRPALRTARLGRRRTSGCRCRARRGRTGPRWRRLRDEVLRAQPLLSGEAE